MAANGRFGAASALEMASISAASKGPAQAMVNDHTAFRVDWMPFAGLRHSGYGVGGIAHTMREMQVRKMMVVKSKEISR